MPLNKAKGRMFKSVGWTWNPVVGCTHNCTYCWAKQLRSRWGKPFEPTLQESAFKDKFPKDDSIIFVCSMGDLFCDGVPDEWIEKVVDKATEAERRNTFLFQTKHPARLYDDWIYRLYKIPFIVGTTLETNRDTPWTEAPPPIDRYYWMTTIKEETPIKTFLSLEPLADFDPETLIYMVRDIEPIAVEIGLENYTHHLPPPPEEKVVTLINQLKKWGIHYILKDNLKHLEEEK